MVLSAREAQRRALQPLPYCEAHYTELFAPRCRACLQPIARAEEEGIEALGASWHAHHFRCAHESCGLDLVAAGTYLEGGDGEPYCVEHYYERFGVRCVGCGELCRDEEEVVEVMGQCWHVADT